MFKRAARDLFNVRLPCFDALTDSGQTSVEVVEYTSKKGSDLRETALVVDGKTVLRFAAVRLNMTPFDSHSLGVWLQEHPKSSAQDQDRQMRVPLHRGDGLPQRYTECCATSITLLHIESCLMSSLTHQGCNNGGGQLKPSEVSSLSDVEERYSQIRFAEYLNQHGLLIAAGTQTQTTSRGTTASSSE